MKKTLIIALLLIVSFTFNSNDIKAYSKSEQVAIEFHNQFALEHETWEHTQVGEGLKLLDTDNKKIGTIYRVYSDDSQEGYIVVSKDLEVLEARFAGPDEYSTEKNRVYYEFPSKFHTKEEAKEIKRANKQNGDYGTGDGYITTFVNRDTNGDPTSFNIFNLSYTINTNTVPDLDHNVEYSSSTMHYSYTIKDTPSYLNELLPGGCVPTSTAMLVAYYDNEWHNTLSTLEGNDMGTPYGVWRPMFPMTAEANATFTDYTSQPVEDLIIELAIDMGSCTTDALGNLNCGTTRQEFSNGLSLYLAGNNHDEWFAIVSPLNDGDPSTDNEFTEYKALIRSGNPSVLFTVDPAYGGGHAVLGIGYTYHIGGNGVYVLDNWDHGSTYLTLTHMQSFGFIYNIPE